MRHALSLPCLLLLACDDGSAPAPDDTVAVLEAENLSLEETVSALVTITQEQDARIADLSARIEGVQGEVMTLSMSTDIAALDSYLTVDTTNNEIIFGHQSPRRTV